MLDVLAVDHAGLAVADLDAAVALMVEVFGARVLRRGSYRPEPGSSEMADQFGVHPDAGWRLVALDVAGTLLEIFEYTAPDRREIAPRASDVGAFHLGLAVPDVDAAVAGLAAESRVTVLGRVQELAAPHPRAGRRWIYLSAAWGLLIELVSDPPSDPSAPAPSRTAG